MVVGKGKKKKKKKADDNRVRAVKKAKKIGNDEGLPLRVQYKMAGSETKRGGSKSVRAKKKQAKAAKTHANKQNASRGVSINKKKK